MTKQLIVSTLIILGIAAATFGQKQVSTQNKADQTLRSTGRVNPSTLGMEVQIPLGGYPGRGPSLPINLSYSSKVWRMKYVETTMTQNNPLCRSLSIPKFSENSASGWSSGMSTPYIEYSGRDNFFGDDGNPFNYSSSPCATPNDGFVSYVRRIQVHLPNGESHELRPDDIIKSYSAVNSSDPNNIGLQANWNATYYAVDGSNIKYVEDSVTGVYRLLLTDGSFLDFASSPSSLDPDNPGDTLSVRKALTLNDRNGNTVTYHDPTSTYPNGYVTDTLGRTIRTPVGLHAPSAATTQSYQLPGLGGGSSVITYQIHWNLLKGASSATSGLTNFSQDLCYQAPGYPYASDPQPPTGSCKLFHNVGTSWTFKTPVEVFNPVVLTAIDLPNGTSYKFSYDLYGRIEQITYPAGGNEVFTYGIVPALTSVTDPSNDINAQANFGVSQRQVIESSGATPIQWTYGAGYTSGGAAYLARTVQPDGTKTERYLKTGNPICTGCTEGTYGYDIGLVGMPYDERVYTAGSTDILGSQKLTTWTTTQLSVSPTNSVLITADWHPRVTREESIVYDISSGAGLSSSTTTDYDTITAITNPVNPTTVKQYGFIVFSSPGSLGTLQRTTETAYVSNSSYDALNLRNLPSYVQTKDAGGTVVSRSEMVYDESGRSPGVVGLLTTAKSWDSTKGAYTNSAAFISASSRFDSYGNQYESTDARGNTATTTFDSTYHVFPTTITSPVPSDGTYGSNSSFVTTSTFDPTTGLPLSVTDANGQTSTMEYNDPLLRPTRTIAPNGQQTIREYGAGTSAATRYVKVISQIDATNWKQAYSWFDGLGRTIRTQAVDVAGDEFVMTCYDNMGRVQKATNPFRGYTNQTCLTITGLDWTTSSYDAASRPSTITTPDNAVVSTGYSLAATSGYLLGTVTTVTDQAGKLRRSVTNALGQLKRVDEPNGSNALGSITAPNQNTDYSYDTLNNLTTVNQGSQTRTFTYDSLSRLKTATNPESGTINYAYDNNGNLTTKTDARPITTTYAYDNLNRVKTRSYSSGTTLPVSYYYDNLTNAKGKLIKVTNGTGANTSTTEYTAFDILGRVTQSKQTTDGVTYGNGTTDSLMTYTYNLGGAMTDQQYPSGRVVKNVLDTTGNLSTLKSSKNAASGLFTYASAFSYTAAGAVNSMKLGNGKWESTTFNNRLQPTQIALGTVQNGTDKLKLNFDYGSTANNGNVQSQTITVPTVGVNTGFTALQSYAYDSLNRLASATETESSTQTWKQAFTYDRYGNRNFNESQTTMPLSFANPAVTDPTVSTTNNRLTSSGYSYDNAGNTLTDAGGKTYTYDAENKQVQVNTGATVIGQYWYDGDGKRIKKYVPATGETTIFVYDAAGKQIAEYSTIVEGTSTAKVNYLTNDHLGSPRINTDANGAIISRHDYHPFGEEIGGAGGRTIGLNYGSDGVRKQFTGYERDNETDLDFAQARYYKSAHGRFSSVDPYNIIFEMEKGRDEKEKQQIFVIYISQPQIWNKYVYSVNNPLNLSDPDGRRPVTAGEQDNLRRFRESGYAYSIERLNAGDWTAQQAEAFRHSVDAASSVIENAILAVPDAAKEDPKNLRAVLYAMGQIGNPSNVALWSNGGTARFNSNGANVSLGAGSNKCTLFVGIAYAMGANIGWNNNGNTGGYQVNWSLSGNVYTPVANDLAAGGTTNFTTVSSPQLGDIAAGRGAATTFGYVTGHAGLAILGDVVISANENKGVRVGSFSPTSSTNTGFRYLRYKP